MADPIWKIATLDEIPAHPYAEGSAWRRIRTHFDISSFGVNAYSADAGTRVIEEHDETGSNSGKHEELYLVISGHATFELDGETVDAPIGTFVHVPNTSTRRGAFATEDGTVVLVLGAKPGQAFSPSPWELAAPAWDAYHATNYEAAAGEMRKIAAQFPENAGTLYNLACFEALAGHTEPALEHLETAVELDDKLRTLAQGDEDFASIRDDPRFPVAVG